MFLNHSKKIWENFYTPIKLTRILNDLKSLNIERKVVKWSEALFPSESNFNLSNHTLKAKIVLSSKITNKVITRRIFLNKSIMFPIKKTSNRFLDRPIIWNSIWLKILILNSEKSRESSLFRKINCFRCVFSIQKKLFEINTLVTIKIAPKIRLPKKIKTNWKKIWKMNLILIMRTWLPRYTLCLITSVKRKENWEEKVIINSI